MFLRCVPGSEPPEPQRVGYYEDRTEAHGESTDHRIQLQREGNEEQPCGNRDADDIIDERPEQILFDIADNGFAELSL